MADINKLKPFILKWEGDKYTNNPLDHGGPTLKGVTLTAFRSYFGKEKGIEDLKKMTDAQWLTVLRRGYWDPFKADQITNQSIANICVDFAWASGTGTAVRKIQRTLGLTPDGAVGPKTLAALNAKDTKKTFEKIKAARLQFVEAICRNNTSQVKWLRGWQNRINAISYDV